MKKLINKISLAGLFLLLATAFVSAQGSGTQKTDRIIFLNGAIKEGKVIAFENEKIHFVHRSETLSYELNKNEIEKIEYASGRIEVINIKRMPEVTMTHVNSRNRVAVMPMNYIGDGDYDRDEEMPYQLQDIAVSFMSRSAAELKFVDVAELNANLLKRGITDDNIRKYTPKELADLLDVEYIIMGSVQQDKGNIVTTNHNQNTRRETVDHRHYYGGHARVTRRSYNNGSSVTRQNIKTQVSLSIYNETGERIYTKSRESILTETDAYKNAIHYMLKRTPLYNR